jgi:hypothetical protein
MSGALVPSLEPLAEPGAAAALGSRCGAVGRLDPDLAAGHLSFDLALGLYV